MSWFVTNFVAIAVVALCVALVLLLFVWVPIHTWRSRRALLAHLESRGFAVVRKPTKQQRKEVYLSLAAPDLPLGSLGIRWFAIATLGDRHVLMLEHLGFDSVSQWFVRHLACSAACNCSSDVTLIEPRTKSMTIRALLARNTGPDGWSENNCRRFRLAVSTDAQIARRLATHAAQAALAKTPDLTWVQMSSGRFCIAAPMIPTPDDGVHLLERSMKLLEAIESEVASGTELQP